MPNFVTFSELLPEAARHRAVERVYPKGRRIFARGDAPAHMYFVIAGEVRLVRTSIQGDEIVLQRAKGGFIAEASLDQEAYHCDAVAAVRSRLYGVPRDAFQAALADRRFNAFWIAHLASELRRVRAQNERLNLRSARDRIVHFIDAHGRDGALTLTRSKKDWAAELGLTHEALYRTLRAMIESGELVVDGVMLQLRGEG